MIQFPLDIPNRDEGEKRKTWGTEKLKRKFDHGYNFFFSSLLEQRKKKTENTDSENTEMIGNRRKKSSY